MARDCNSSATSSVSSKSLWHAAGCQQIPGLSAIVSGSDRPIAHPATLFQLFFGGSGAGPRGITNSGMSDRPRPSSGAHSGG